MPKRPIITLFMLESLDGKISSGSSDTLDADKDFCRIDGVKEGLQQYYDIEQTTDLCSLNTGRVMTKIGVNERKFVGEKSPCTFVIIDNKPHLNKNGIDYLSKWVTKLIIVTTNKFHPVYDVKDSFENIDVLYYDSLDLTILMQDLYEKYNIENITVQSGGTLNSEFVRAKLLDYVNIVIAPLLVGGADVSTLVDGKGITSESELDRLMPLELIECNKLNNSYVQLKYKVV